MKGKILALIILGVAVYLVFTTFFVAGFKAGLAEVRELEEKNNAREAFLVPITVQEIKNYKNGLNALKVKYSSDSALKKLFEIKTDLAVIQENLIVIGENFERANKIYPDCSVGSKFETVKQLSGETLKKANSVLVKRNAFVKNFSKEALSAEEISKTKFENAVKGLKSGVKQIQKIVASYC